MEEIYKNLSLENLEGEIWRNIEGYNGKYQVSNMGRIKNLNYNRTKQEKILRQRKFKDGYLHVSLCKYGKVKTCKVHRLVAIAFIPNTNNYPTVNHNNEIKTDNRVSNLCWMSYSQQQRHGTCTQRRVASTDWKSVGRKNAEKLTNGVRSKQVYQYSLDGTLVGIWQSTNEAGRNGYKQAHVSDCCLGKVKSHRGYIWSYTPLDSF